MLETLPKDPQTIVNLDWASFAPIYERLQAQELRRENVSAWLEKWSDLMRLGQDPEIALTTAGWQWPSESTAIPAPRSLLNFAPQ